jgi:hypothetical protein
MYSMTNDDRPPKAIAAEKKERAAADGRKAMADHIARQAFVKQNTARLRALRLAKEAAEQAERAAEPPPTDGPVKKKRRRTEPSVGS